MLRRIAREPLLHFVLLGGGVFAAWQFLSPEETPSIAVSGEAIASMEREFRQQMGRPASSAESVALLDDYVNQELLYREAIALGLDRGDPIIRRRLIQKMGFLNEDRYPVPEPEEAALASWLTDHAEDYRVAQRVSFRHVYFRHPVDAALALEQSVVLEDIQSLGAPFVRGNVFRDQTLSDVKNVFGDKFAGQVITAPAAQWVGPVQSAYGFHLVEVSGHSPSTIPDLSEVREQVLLDWRQDQRRRRDEEAIEALRSRYEIALPKGAE